MAIKKVPKVIALFETTLASAISATATTLTLTSASDKEGTSLANDTYGITVDEGSANEEFIVAEINGTAGTNAKRGISVVNGTSEVASLKKAHRRGATVKITNAPVLPIISRILRGEETVDYTPTENGHLVTKGYADNIGLEGAPNAGASTKGVTKLSVAPVSSTEPIAVGDNDQRMPTEDEKDAMAGSAGTPSATNKFVTEQGISNSLTAGEALTGATLPQPVYVDTTSGKVYLCDANVSTKLQFVGFATTTASADASVVVKTDGVVAGFTGLTVGVEYYLNDAVGTISATKGTNTVRVGIALSATQLLITRGVLRKIGTASLGDGTTAVTLGFRPKVIRAHCTYNTTGDLFAYTSGVWEEANGYACVYRSHSATSSTSDVSTSYILVIRFSNGNVIVAVTITPSATGFSFVVDNFSTEQAQIMWEAEG